MKIKVPHNAAPLGLALARKAARSAARAVPHVRPATAVGRLQTNIVKKGA